MKVGDIFQLQSEWLYSFNRLQHGGDTIPRVLLTLLEPGYRVANARGACGESVRGWFQSGREWFLHRDLVPMHHAQVIGTVHGTTLFIGFDRLSLPLVGIKMVARSSPAGSTKKLNVPEGLRALPNTRRKRANELQRHVPEGRRVVFILKTGCELLDPP